MRRAALVCALALAACSGDAGDSKELNSEELRNATYTGILDTPVTLADGRFEGEPFASGSASRPVVTLVPDTIARGDLTGDGVDEAAVALAHNSGGSGVFVYLAVVKRERGGTQNIATIALGDRTRVSAIGIDAGRIVADLVEHGPEDPMCCPTRQVRGEWLLREGRLIRREAAAEPQLGRFSGNLIWGHESRSFTECDSGREGWVIDESGDELVEVYEDLTSSPYQPMFVEVRAEWVPAPEEGFGSDFDEALRVTEVVRAENEGFGCRLDLDDVLFIASGNEPSWRLQVREEGIVMRSMETPGEVEYPSILRRGQPPKVIFDAEGPDSAIRISLEQRRCVDSMSGARYAWSATVEIDGRRLTGCAAEGI